MFIHYDVTIEEEVSRAMDEAAARFGELDVMVNNVDVTGDKVTNLIKPRVIMSSHP
jgi:xanthoxin dehydrogenase